MGTLMPGMLELWTILVNNCLYVVKSIQLVFTIYTQLLQMLRNGTSRTKYCMA